MKKLDTSQLRDEYDVRITAYCRECGNAIGSWEEGWMVPEYLWKEPSECPECGLVETHEVGPI